MEGTEKFSSPDILGPGVWFFLHLKASKATTREAQLEVCRDIRLLADNFRCMTCKPHFQKHVATYPPEKTLHVEKGLFIWLWNMHNIVNKRLGKRMVTMEDAWNYYSDSNEGLCENCGVGSHDISVSQQFVPDKIFESSKEPLKETLTEQLISEKKMRLVHTPDGTFNIPVDGDLVKTSGVSGVGSTRKKELPDPQKAIVKGPGFRLIKRK